MMTKSLKMNQRKFNRTKFRSLTQYAAYSISHKYKRYTNYKQRKLHRQKRVLSNNTQNLYSCKMCEQKFKKKINLKGHIRLNG